MELINSLGCLTVTIITQNRIDMAKKLFTLLFISTIGLFLTTYTYAKPKVVEKVAAIVNNNVILESDVNDMILTIKNSTEPKNLPDMDTLRHQVIERLIVDSLVLQQGAKIKMTVSDEDVNNAIKNIAQENGITVNELRSYLASMGLSFSNYQDRIRNDLLIEQTRMNEVRQRITISDKEVDDLASTIAKQPLNNREVNISHILITIPENPTKKQVDEATEKAKDIIRQLQKGGNFAKLAASYSSDDYALKGGNMGWHRLNELPSIFEERLVRAQKDDIIGPLRSGVGYHILKVDNIRADSQKPVTVKEVNARHILIKTNVLVTDDIAKEKLNQLILAIKDGSITFEGAAQRYSEDPGSAEKGGDLGWNNPERYDNTFKNTLLKLKKNEISVPIKSAFGWHIIQLIDTRNIDRTDLAQKEQAYRLIFNRKFTEELQVWIQEIKSDAYIKIMDEETNE